MKIFSKSTAIVTLLLVVGSVFQGCKKYEEGPMISFKSRTERVSNTWKIDNYKINGSDYTSLMGSYDETFTNKGAYSYNWGLISGSGKWEFQNRDKEIKLNGIEEQSSHTLNILKLEENAFWYYYMKDGDRHEFHLISK